MNDTFSRTIDVSAVMTLCAMLIVVSALVFMLELSRRRDRVASVDHGTRALLWAHVFYLIAAGGLELGNTTAFATSAVLVVIGTHCGLVAGYLGLRAVIERAGIARRWIWSAAAVSITQAALAVLSQNLALLFVSTSVANGFLALFFAIDIRRRARAADARPVWLLVLPFAAICAAYLFRLALVANQASESLLVISSIAIGFVFPVATLFWVFGAMALRNHRLALALDRSATRDALTGLENRAALERFKSRPLPGEGANTGRYFACLCIDLDRFKETNDSFGHAAGDAVLVETARRLSRKAMPGDRVFRIGGDEFVYWRECDDGEDHEAFIEALMADLSRPITYGKIALTVGVSIGVDLARQDAAPMNLIRRADIALNHSKERGRNRSTIYNVRLGASYDARLASLVSFRDALNREEIDAYFQPQINARTGEVTGCEALARWRHPERGILAPGEFLPLAEELGMLHLVDRRVLDLSVAAMTDWARAGTPVPRVSINVSKARLLEPSLLEDLRRRSAACPGVLAIEVLETVFVDDDRLLMWQVDTLRDIGIGIDIDDFGTGRASISAVLALRPDRIKIDRRFVMDIETSAAKRDLLISLVELCVRLNASPLIEGLETEAQIEIVRRMGSIDVQGFGVAYPMDRTDMTRWLADRTLAAEAVVE